MVKTCSARSFFLLKSVVQNDLIFVTFSLKKYLFILKEYTTNKINWSFKDFL
jgi:hypothetical protein